VHEAGPAGCDTPQADIAVSADADRVVVVQVADCVPLLMADAAGRAVAASHAGWRGTAAGVAAVTAQHLTSRFGIEAGSLRAGIGPSIGPCCYQVGDELPGAFLDAGWSRSDTGRWFSARDGRLYLDLWRANADQLEQAGVPAAQVSVSRLCTACHADWFCSYRREGAGTGRLAGYIRANG
jgi:polyphenol oxidase